MNYYRSIKNFTLIEVILAIFIFSIVMTIVGMSIFSIKKSYENVDKFNRKMEKLQVIDRFANLSMRNIIPFKWLDRNKNKNRHIFYGRRNELIFAYMHRVNEVKMVVSDL